MQKDHLLSEEEKSVVNDKEWLYAKHRIIGKVYVLFGGLSEEYKKILGACPSVPHEVLAVSPKIYKGENYLWLPYVMLDHPRFFSGKDAFAIRSLFWWGQGFSIHLVLGGKYKERFIKPLMENIRYSDKSGWFISTTNDPWHHHFERDNYQPLHEQNNPEGDNYQPLQNHHKSEEGSYQPLQNPNNPEEGNYQPLQNHHNPEEEAFNYLKLGCIHPLDQWNDADEFFIRSFTQLMQWLKEAD